MNSTLTVCRRQALESVLITSSCCCFCLIYTNWLTQVIGRSLGVMCVFHCRKTIFSLLCDGQSMSRPISICVFLVFRAYEQHNYTAYLCLSVSLKRFRAFLLSVCSSQRLILRTYAENPKDTPRYSICITCRENTKLGW